jgi:FKBP-type peptidyl-prolyl cis-trans isomerase FkpA
MKNLVLLFVCSFVLFSCGDQAADDEQLILDYLAENNLTAEVTEDGLYYIIDNPGNGENPSINSTVNVDYSGYFMDGSVFDANDDIEFGLWQVIEGWQLGIPLLGKGGNGTFLLPSSLGYGSAGSGSIPGNTVIIFDVTLNDFN